MRARIEKMLNDLVRPNLLHLFAGRDDIIFMGDYRQVEVTYDMPLLMLTLYWYD